MAPPEDANTNRRQPESTAAFNIATVPTTLRTASPAGSRSERETPPWAARWRRTSGRSAMTAAAAPGGVVLALVLRATRAADLGEAMSDVSPPLVLAAAAAAFGFILCRAWRYRLLLAGTHGRFGTLLAITLSGWGVSLLLPGPGGDAALV